MHEVERRVLIELQAYGVDLSITNEVVMVWAAGLVTFLLLLFAFRRDALIPKGVFRNFFEAIFQFIDKEVVAEGIGDRGRPWAPFLLTLFFFILLMNLLGLLPFPEHIKAMTSNVNVTGALAVIVFGVIFVINIRHHGAWGFLRKFKPEGVPWWLAFLVVPIEITTWLIKPISLTIRLCANMVAGHLVIGVFVSMVLSAQVLMKPLPFLGAVAMSAFEIFVSFVQAFIFTILAGLYIREALDEAH